MHSPNARPQTLAGWLRAESPRLCAPCTQAFKAPWLEELLEFLAR